MTSEGEEEAVVVCNHAKDFELVHEQLAEHGRRISTLEASMSGLREDVQRIPTLVVEALASHHDGPKLEVVQSQDSRSGLSGAQAVKVVAIMAVTALVVTGHADKLKMVVAWFGLGGGL